MAIEKRVNNKDCRKLGSVPENITRWALAFSVAMGVIMAGSTDSYAGFSWTPSSIPIQHSGPSINPAPTVNVEVETIIERNTVTEENMVTEERELVVGFGRDMPLAFALRQIVPSEYAYSFDQDVSQAARINWDGGKPWDVVLQEALAPSGLRAKIIDNVIWVRWETTDDITEDSATIVENKILTTVPVIKADMQMGLLELQTDVGEREQGSFYTDYELQAETEYVPSYPRHRPSITASEETATYKPQIFNRLLNVFRSEEEEKPQDAVPARYEADTSYFVPAGAPMSLIEDITKPEPYYYTPSKVMDPYEVRFWNANKNASLRDTLMEWSESAGVKMFWGSRYDYRLPATVRMQGTFPDAVTAVLTVYTGAEHRPLGRLHPNLPDGPSVLIIENYASRVRTH